MKMKIRLILCLVALSLMVNPMVFGVRAQENVQKIDPAISGVMEPEIGSTPSPEGITAAEGSMIRRLVWQEYDAHGSLTGSYGYNYELNFTEGTAFSFREGYSYCICVSLSVSQENTVFSGVSASVNGEPVHPLATQSGGDWAEFTYFFGGKALYRVGLTGVQEPKPGETASFAGIALEETAENYEIYSMTWMQTNDISLTTDEYTQIIGGEAVGEPFVFQEGYVYSLRVTVQTKEGYLFHTMVRPYINGEDYALQYTDGTQCQLIRIWNASAMGNQQAQLVQPAVEGVIPPVIGQKASMEDVHLPEGAEGYRIASLIWKEYDMQGTLVNTYAIYKEGGYANIVGTAFEFREDFRYSLHISLETESAWQFNQEDADYYTRSFLINGSAVDPLYARIGLGYADAVCYFGFDSVPALQIMGAEKPQQGSAASFDGIQVPEGYQITKITWTEYDHSAYSTCQWSWLPEQEAYEGQQITFRQNCSYGLRVYVKAADGAVLDSNIAITVDEEIPTRVQLQQQTAQVVMVWNSDGSAVRQIDSVALQIKPVFGQMAGLEAIEVPEGCKLLSVGWTEADPNGQLTGQWIVSAAGAEHLAGQVGQPFAFREGYSYSAAFLLAPEEGWCFGELPRLYVNETLMGMGQVQTCFLSGSAKTTVQQPAPPEPPEQPDPPEVNPPHGDGIACDLLVLTVAGWMLLLLWRKNRDYR